MSEVQTNTKMYLLNNKNIECMVKQVMLNSTSVGKKKKYFILKNQSQFVRKEGKKKKKKIEEIKKKNQL